jgi:shikimate kinase
MTQIDNHLDYLLNQKIFLIGFMGCGKSKLGKATALKLEVSFLDLDTLIETINHQSIPQLFENLGEEGFRIKEKEALQQSVMANNAIIATGGGAPCFFDNMDWMNNNGVTIFIDTPVNVLADRLINAKVERPLVKGKSYEELLDFIATKLNERRPFYEQAQIVIKEGDLNAEMLIDALTQKR